MVQPESECFYFRAKGIHLYLAYEVQATGASGEACHGCGLERTQG